MSKAEKRLVFDIKLPKEAGLNYALNVKTVKDEIESIYKIIEIVVTV